MIENYTDAVTGALMTREVCTAIKSTSATITTASVVVAATNYARRGFTLYNNSSNTRYVVFGETASGASPSIIMPTFSHWVWPITGMCYTGVISAIGNAGTGNMTITEFL